MAITKHLLPRFKGQELAQGVADAMNDEEGTLGAARWLLGEDGWRNLDESDRQRLLTPLVQRALQYRHMDTRKKVMNALCEIGSPWAAESLRGLLSRPTEPGWKPANLKYGWRIKLVDGGEVRSDECSDAVWAAFCLAKIGETKSLPALRELADKYQGPDKDLLPKAVTLLQNNTGRTPR
jgi:HEAT repeat protein